MKNSRFTQRADASASSTVGRIAAICTLFIGPYMGADGAFAQAASQEIVILAYGDSLTAGYHLPPDASFPAQLEKALREKGYAVRVLNSGVSGDTAEDGLARLEWSLNEKVDAAIVELGANDALRGIPPKRTERALDQILNALKAKNVELLMAGIEAPNNWGQAYATDFRAIYPKLTSKYNALFYPVFVKDVLGVATLNQADGIHPTREGIGIIVRNILPDVEALIDRVKQKRAKGM